MIVLVVSLLGIVSADDALYNFYQKWHKKGNSNINNTTMQKKRRKRSR